MPSGTPVKIEFIMLVPVVTKLTVPSASDSATSSHVDAIGQPVERDVVPHLGDRRGRRLERGDRAARTPTRSAAPIA